LAGFDISHQQFKTMMWIRNCGKEGTHLHRIARSLGVTPRNVTGLVDGLEALGLVERVADPADRRALIARLTPAGEARVAAAAKVNQRIVRKMGEALTEQERVMLRHACLKLSQALEAKEKT